MRLIYQTEVLKGKQAKVYRDEDWQEYVVKFFSGGKHMDASDYHTDNKEDAIGTAKYSLAQELKYTR